MRIREGEANPQPNPLSYPPLKYKSGHDILSSSKTVAIVSYRLYKTIVDDAKQ
jgi:hypothetical protein